MFRLQGRIQHYDWGSYRELPEFLGLHPDGQPWAEIWYGSHPSAPAAILSAQPGFPAHDSSTTNELEMPAIPHALDEFIAAHPAAVLGPYSEPDGMLPYLVKILSAGQPLSLQAHPDAEQAAAGYEREHSQAIPAGQRNYSDNRPKPETLIALAPTRALAGFRDPSQIVADLRRLDTPCLESVIIAMTEASTAQEALERGFGTLLRLDQQAVDSALSQITRLTPDNRADDWGRDALTTAAEIHSFYPHDAGVIATVFLNAVRLAPGDSLSLAAGVVHCYVSGLGLEVMANSDNVLRAGLTTKRVNRDELMQIVNFTTGNVIQTGPEVMELDRAGARIHDYRTPARQYAVKFYELHDDNTQIPIVENEGPRIVVGLDGIVAVRSAGSRVALAPGDAAFGMHREELTVSGHGCVAVVRCPGHE